jgi:hypothetical protein
MLPDRPQGAEREAHLANLAELYAEGGEVALGGYASAVLMSQTYGPHLELSTTYLELFRGAQRQVA